MEEADKIVLATLRETGCSLKQNLNRIGEIDAPVLVQVTAEALDRVSPETDGSEWPNTLPNNVAARHRICTQLAAAVKNLGYRGDFGYSQLLYPNERDTRRFLLFLVDVLPKHVEERPVEDNRPIALLTREIGHSLHNWMTQSRNAIPPWQLLKPSVKEQMSTAVRSANALYIPPSLIDNIALDNDDSQIKDSLLSYQNEHLPAVSSLASSTHSLATKLLETESKIHGDQLSNSQWYKLDKGSSEHIRARARNSFNSVSALSAKDIDVHELAYMDLANIIKHLGNTSSNRVRTFFCLQAQAKKAANGVPSHIRDALTDQVPYKDSTYNRSDETKQDETEKQGETKDLATQRAEQIQALETEFQQATDKMLHLQHQLAHAEQLVNIAETSLAAEQEQTGLLENNYTTTKEALKFIAKDSGALKELKNTCSSLAQEIVQISTEFELKRRPLLDKLRQVKRADVEKEERAERIKNETTDLQAQIRTTADDVSRQEEMMRQLQRRIESQSTSQHRAEFTRRIIDLTNETRKQRTEILQMVGDIRMLQGELGRASDKLARTATVTEDLLYRGVQEHRKEPIFLDVYRTFTTIREQFQSLIEIVQKGCDAENEEREFDSSAELLTQRTAGLNVDQLKKDLHNIKSENESLMNR